MKLDDRMLQDRLFYLQCIGERAVKDGADSLTMDYYNVLARDDEMARYWWITAASRMDIHRAMVRCGWEPQLPNTPPKDE